MSITIGNYSFDGPYSSIDRLKDKSGVYAILCHKQQKYHLVDVGEAAKVRSRVENHDRKNCWQSNCKSTLCVAVYYTPHSPQPGRRAIEQEIRNQYNPPCGER